MAVNLYMNNYLLGQVIRPLAETLHEESSGFWKFDYQECVVFVITDESHNRMRIMAPVAEAQSLDSDIMQTLLSANYNRALDARYCINDETLWSAFIHPLEQLANSQFVDALNQVVNLSKNYGTSFSSGDLIFGH